MIGLGHGKFEIDVVGRFPLTRLDSSRWLDQIVRELRDTSFVDPSSDADSVRAAVAAWLDGALANELLVNADG